MPLEKVPRNPLSKNFRPTNSEPYRVRDGDNWKSVAAKLGIDVGLLIEFNFHTKDPREVNYYLRDRVGCVLQTPDKNNWRFSSAAKPGIIYIPLQKTKVFLLVDGVIGSSIDPQRAGSIEAASFSFGGRTVAEGQTTSGTETKGMQVVIARPPASSRDISRLQSAVTSGRNIRRVVVEVFSVTDDDLTITIRNAVIVGIDLKGISTIVTFDFTGGITIRKNR